MPASWGVGCRVEGGRGDGVRGVAAPSPTAKKRKTVGPARLGGGCLAHLDPARPGNK